MKTELEARNWLSRRQHEGSSLPLEEGLALFPVERFQHLGHRFRLCIVKPGQAEEHLVVRKTALPNFLGSNSR